MFKVFNLVACFRKSFKWCVLILISLISRYWTSSIMRLRWRIEEYGILLDDMSKPCTAHSSKASHEIFSIWFLDSPNQWRPNPLKILSLSSNSRFPSKRSTFKYFKSIYSFGEIISILLSLRSSSSTSRIFLKANASHSVYFTVGTL